MRNYIIRRLLQMIPVFLGILFILFFLLDKTPGGPASNLMDPKMTPEQRPSWPQSWILTSPFMRSL